MFFLLSNNEFVKLVRASYLREQTLKNQSVSPSSFVNQHATKLRSDLQCT